MNLRVCRPLYKSSSTYFQHIIKVYTSDRHDTDLENHTVVIRKMRSAGLYSTARYSLFLEQYIDRYLIRVNLNLVTLLDYCLFTI